VFQFLAVGFVLLPWTADLGWFHDVMLWTAVAISVVSAVDIVRQGWVEAAATPPSERAQPGSPGLPRASETR
jgi:hypothetical protein